MLDKVEEEVALVAAVRMWSQVLLTELVEGRVVLAVVWLCYL
jgi:hypothetical protein